MAEQIRPLTIDERVVRLIAEFQGMGNDQIAVNSTLRGNDPLHDSLDDVELVMEFENNFKIEISDEDADSLAGQPVQAYIDYFSNRKDIPL